MNISDIIQIALFLLVLLVFSPLLGRYMARVFLDESLCSEVII